MIKEFICNICWISWDKEIVPKECCPVCEIPLTKKVSDEMIQVIEITLQEPVEIN